MDLKITSFKIGDKVKRVKGYHVSGMRNGDIGTIIDVALKDNKIHIGLKEYPGWHYVDNFLKTDYNLKYNANAQRKKSRLQRLEDELTKIELKKIEIEYEMADIRDNQIKEIEVSSIEDPFINVQDIKFFRQGNNIICKMYDSKNNVMGRGRSKPCPGDKFDLKIGQNIAFNRAMINLHRKEECKIIKNTFK